MRKDLGAKHYVYPMPVFVIATYDENGVPNAMNAAWGCVADYKKIAIIMDASHKTYKNIVKNKAFTVSMCDVNNMVYADYVGIVSGNNDSNKLAKTPWNLVKSNYVNAPIIEELPLCLECKFESFDEDKELLIGEIVNVSCDEAILDEKGVINPSLLKPITYDPANHAYYVLGEKVGNAFSDGKKIK